MSDNETKTPEMTVPDCNWDAITKSNRVVASASKEGITKDYGFDTLTFPWNKFQVWAFPATKDKPAWNPVSLYKGAIQYKIAYSEGSIECENIRIFGDVHKFQVEVPREMFMYVCKCLGIQDDAIANWEADAIEYKKPATPASNDASETY